MTGIPRGTVNRRAPAAAPEHHHVRGAYPTATARPGGASTLGSAPAGTVNHPRSPRPIRGADTLFAHFATTGGLTTAIVPRHRANPALAGTVALSVAIIGGSPNLTTQLAGGATLTAAATARYNAGTGNATAGGTLTVTAVQRHAVPVGFTTDATLAPAVVSTPQRAADFAGAGALSIASMQSATRTTDLSADGALTVTRGRSWWDPFPRANSSNLGGAGQGWVQGGTGSGIGITGNRTSWGNGGTSDGVGWALRTEDTLTNNFHVGIIVSTAGTRSSRVILGANATMTQYAQVRWTSTTVTFGRSNGSFNTWTDLEGTSMTVGAGTIIDVWAWDDTYEVFAGGGLVARHVDTGGLILRDATTRRVGLAQERASFANSGFAQEWWGGDAAAAA